MLEAGSLNEKQCRELVRNRAESMCERCTNVSRGLTVHHRLKRSHGGKWDATNCVLLCGHGTIGCHGWVEHNPNEAAKTGWHVRPWENPAEIPVLWRGSDWTLLTPEGALNHVETDIPVRDRYQ